jgi:hypothetical protein
MHHITRVNCITFQQMWYYLWYLTHDTTSQRLSLRAFAENVESVTIPREKLLATHNSKSFAQRQSCSTSIQITVEIAIVEPRAYHTHRTVASKVECDSQKRDNICVIQLLPDHNLFV